MNNTIILTRSNPCMPSPRLNKQAESLLKHNFNVKVLGWDRDNNCKKKEIYQGYEINRFKLKAPYGSFKLFFYLILWNLYEFFYLLFNKWDIVHSFDLDTAFPAFFASLIKRKKMIYDICDFYSDCLPLGTPSFLRKFISSLEHFIIKRANWVIIADSSRVSQIKVKRREISVIMNTPPEINVKLDFIKNKKFTIFFAGILSKTRSLVEMAQTIEQIPNSQFILAGFGDNAENIATEIKKFKKTIFLGKLSYAKVLEYSAKSDALFAIYDPKVPNHRFSSANKLFEAMMLSKPVIVAKDTSMDKIVEKENMGFVVNYGDLAQLKNVLLKLKNNPQLAKKIGENGKKAYDREYNWKTMEKRLIKIHKRVLR